MTTLFSTSIAANHTPALRRGRVAFVALWLTQIALAGMFLLTGGLKLTGAPELVALFNAIGIGHWFRYMTGSVEVVRRSTIRRQRTDARRVGVTSRSSRD
jgi:putative oxidoreductase